jgi:hypothetical protein
VRQAHQILAVIPRKKKKKILTLTALLSTPQRQQEARNRRRQLFFLVKAGALDAMLPPLSSAPSRLLPRRTVASATASSPSPSPPPSRAGGHGRRPLRYAVLGAGFAGLSVAWHLLKVTLHFPSSSSLSLSPCMYYDKQKSAEPTLARFQFSA